jgi:putative protein-disulfide isomerase
MTSAVNAPPAPPYEPVDPDVIDILEFTDPVCVWCWGSEPVLRGLQHQYGDQLRVGYVMGGLVENVDRFHDPSNNIGGGAEAMNRQVASHWLEASTRNGMPIGTDGFGLFSDEYPSTYPQNVAYKAAQQQGEVLANRFLRRMREATAVEALVTSSTDVQVQLAAEVGLDVGAFLDAVHDGSAQRAFTEDQKFIRTFGSSGFPAFLIRFRGKQGLLPGWQPLSSFRKVLDNFTDGLVKPRTFDTSDEGALAFVSQHDRVAPVEVSTALNLSREEADGILDRLHLAGRIEKVEAGNGHFVRPAVQDLSCDTRTGLCLTS